MSYFRKDSGEKFLFSISQHLMECGIALHEPPLHIDKGNTDRCPVKDGLKFFFTSLQDVSYPNKIRNIKQKALEKTGFTCLVAYHHGLIMHPYDMTIMGYQTILGAKGYLVLATVVNGCQDTLSVIEMKSLNPEITFDQPSGGGET
jgi:hypothetical protein